MNYTIRLANQNDCKELSELKHQVWTETYRGIYSDEKIDNFDYLKNEKYFLDVGYMSCGTPLRPYKDYKQDVGLLYILQKYQRKGIGKELFNIAYRSIKENGYKKFFISCNKYNTSAQAFYKKMGGIIDEIDDENIDKSIPQIKFIYKIKGVDPNE